MGAILVYGITYSVKKEEARHIPPPKSELVVYTDIPTNVSAVLAAAYEQEYHVKINMLPLTEEQMAARLSKDIQDGDVVITSANNLQIGEHHNVFKPFVSEQGDLVQPNFKQPDGYWVGLWYDPVVFVIRDPYYKGDGKQFNTWQSLRTPGNWGMVMPDFAASQSAANILYSFVEVYGEEGSLKGFVDMKPHVIQYAKFLSTSVRLAALGETDIAIGNYSDAKQFANKHYPIAIVFPQDGTPYYLTGVALLNKTKHVEESQQFITWLLSVQGANTLLKNDFFMYLLIQRCRRC